MFCVQKSSGQWTEIVAVFSSSYGVMQKMTRNVDSIESSAWPDLNLMISLRN